jgi:hypothetical protein
MHSLLATFFAAIFSFCHASSVQQAMNRPVVVAQEEPPIFGYVPSHREIAQAQTTPAMLKVHAASARR